ncbi:MAG: penicillin-binding protein 1C [Deltaproteobacteria bacterium]|nr:penicillin-binding protein 1C [Deltaproteobacteria bacterium]
MAIMLSNLGKRARSWLTKGRIWRAIGLAVLLPPVALVLLAAITPLPEALRARHGFDSSVRVLDRHGKVLAEVRADDGARARWVPIEQVGPDLANAILAAEDRRFYRHPGVDPIAIARAAGQDLWHRRIVSGASTLTQQLARTVKPRRRTLAGKVGEMAVALRIEASLSKKDILEQYLNLVFFGPSLRGVEAASRFYFDKPCNALSLAEAATLAALPRGPTVYDPRKSPQAVQRRRDRILDRMQRDGLASAEAVERAKSEPLTIHLQPTGFSAPHLVRGLLSGAVHPEIGPLADRASTLRTTIDASLQKEVQTAARSQLDSLRDRHVSAASVVVIDNATGEVLAWLGAPDFLDELRFGQNDGVLALRQPGSALKPFVYSVAIDDLGWTAATVLPDIELHISTDQGDYSPHNYDGQLHGPVRMRDALANSYNVPAVHAASVVGPARVLSRLQRLGMRTLQEDAEHYGAAIALGDGEVRLVDLAGAYAALARGGVLHPFRAISAATDRKGMPIELPAAASERVLDAGTAAVLVDMLKDPHARIGSFGSGNVLELPFEVAVKTGTSKGFRDNLTVGSTREVTVAVWVGNFDGSPMQGVSGITGAGPLFRAVMLAAMKGRTPEPFTFSEVQTERLEVCALSGKRPSSTCKHRVTETFVKGTAPDQTCDMHVELPIDKRNGLKAGPSCPASEMELKTLESYEGKFAAWALGARRPVVPARFSPLCPGPDDSAGAQAGLSIRYPYPGATFHLDPSLNPDAQGIVVRADAPSRVTRMRFVVDGKVVGVHGPPFEHTLRLEPGEHRVWVETDGNQRSAAIEFDVQK